MPNIQYEGNFFDTIAVCVDRHSGWIVAIPCLAKGLTGAKLAKEMVKHQWRPFGIPSIISSDQGSHFTSTWFQNLCSLLGIRQAYSQAYHHQANGRVERAGQQIMEILRKLHADEKVNWVEALPRVVCMCREYGILSTKHTYMLVSTHLPCVEAIPRVVCVRVVWHTKYQAYIHACLHIPTVR